MGGRIGPVELEFDLYWETQFKITTHPSEDGNRARKNLDGDDVWCYVGKPNLNSRGEIQGIEVRETHSFRFTMLTFAQMQELKSLKLSNSAFSVCEGDYGDTLENCYFSDDQDWIDYEPEVVPVDAFSFGSTKGTKLEYMRGVIRVYTKRVT